MILIKEDTQLLNLDGTKSRVTLGAGNHDIKITNHRDGFVKCNVNGNEYLLKYKLEKKDKE